MQFFQQNHLKIDLQLAKKVRYLSAAFPGNEKDAAETALFLNDRNIEASEEMTARLLNIMQGKEPATDYEKDILSYINHKKGSGKHWLLIPFSDQGYTSLNGLIRILIDTELKKTEKIVIDCKTTVKKYYFVLQLHGITNKSPKRFLSYCTEPPLRGTDIRSFTNQLRSLFARDGIDAMYYKQSLAEDGIFCDNTELSFFQGSV